MAARRSVKSANIMSHADGAVPQATGQRSIRITSVPTPNYATIEQDGQSAANVGPWADFHALGMAAHHCLSGIGDGQLPGTITRCYLKCKGKQHKALAPAVKVGKSRPPVEALLETAQGGGTGQGFHPRGCRLQC